MFEMFYEIKDKSFQAKEHSLLNIADGIIRFGSYYSKTLQKYLTDVQQQNTFQKRSENEQPSWEPSRSSTHMIVKQKFGVD